MITTNGNIVLGKISKDYVLVQKTKHAEKTDDERAAINRLKEKDTEVRTHENQHMSQPGVVSSGARYVYQTGPDGKQYAVGGEVTLSISASTPDDAIYKAQALGKAAMSPGKPSSQDFGSAIAAKQMENLALMQKQNEKAKEESSGLSEIRKGLSPEKIYKTVESLTIGEMSFKHNQNVDSYA